jgi:ATP-dependent Clp protease ATP-binding subunit ClpA
MNEYQDESAGNRLLGHFEQKEPGILIKLIRENPFCVLLLNEIEKANKNILNLFLTAFDEGYLTDNFGKKASLQEMIIVATSNAGAEFIRQKIALTQDPVNFKKELIDHLLTNGIFSPEFLNRFDSIIIYKPLGKPQLIEIARLLLIKLNERISDRGIKVKITDSLLNQVADLGFDPVFGARPMKRLVQDKIEAPLAKKILSGEAEKGIEIEFNLT